MGLGLAPYFFGFGLTHYIPYLIYIGVFVAIALTLFYRIEVGLFFLIPLTPLEAAWVKLWDLPLGTHLIDLLVAALFIALLLRKRDFPGKTSMFWPVMILIIISFAGLFIGSSEFPLTADNAYLKFWKNFILMPLIYILTFNIVRDEKQTRLLIYLMTFYMLANFFYFHSSFEGMELSHFDNSERISTFRYVGPNEMASFVSQSTMLLFGIWLAYRNKWSRLLIGAAILGNIYVVLYSFSRAGYLCMVAGCLVLGLLKYRRILIVLLALGFFWANVLPTAVIERLKMTYQEDTGLDHASAVRVDVWREGINTFISNPLGMGFNKYKALGFGDTGRRDAHNMYIKMLVELGIPGLGIYLLLYILGLRSGWILFRNAQDEFTRGLGLGFMACVVTSMISNMFGQEWMFFSVTTYYWVFWALVERARAGCRKNEAVFSLNPSLEGAINR